MHLTRPQLGGAALLCGLMGLINSCAGAKHLDPEPDGGSGGAPALDAALDRPSTSPSDDVAPMDTPVGPADAGDDQGPGIIPDPRKTLGLSCSVDSECRSEFCVDGVCCGSACAGACLSCAVKGSVGQCIPAEIGTDPRDQCPDQGLATCGTDGVCDGAGACRKYPSGITCQVASCAGSTMTLASRCDGTGTCVPTAAQSCTPFSCDPKGTCRTSCKIDTDCAAPNTCVNGSCGKKPLGTACSTAGQCNSGFCEQGICCGTACDGTCRSCALPGTAGTCATVPAGQDPLGQCADSGASSCGTDGTCDGAGACRSYLSGTTCVPGTCSAGTESRPRRCDGLGTCQPGNTRSCEAFNCGANAGCLTTCASSNDCATDYFCIAGSCAKKARAAPCASGAECATGLCQQGVCCNEECTGGCRACNLTGQAGTCKPILAGQDPLSACATSDATGCGTTGVCDGNGACALYSSDTVCGPGSCTGARETQPSRCNGAGACLTGGTRDCMPYLCAASKDICLLSCAADTECVAGNVCVAKSCGKKPLGDGCGDGGECASTICAQGVCCATACTGTCQSCAVTISKGTCSPVADGGAEPQSRCAKADVASCGTDGTCDGKGACRLYGASTTCAAATCVAAMFTPARSCSGAGTGAGAGGTCTAATATPCPGAFQCDAAGAACRTTCSLDAHCVAPNVCIGGVCRKKDLATQCDANNECASGFCQQHVCCGSECTGTCRSCNLTPTAGTCTNVPLHGSSDGACPVDAANSCKRNGLCDGAAGCELSPAGEACGPATCSGDTIIGARTCDGIGSCKDGPTTQCRPFTCNASGSCKMTCTVDGDCFAPSTCIAGICTGGKINGDVCTGDTDCQSKHCSPQKVCCDDACVGSCRSCNLAPASKGTCTNIKAGDPSLPGPGSCADQGSASCGTNGKCDGSAACQNYPIGTSCGTATCGTSGTTPPVSALGIPVGRCTAPTTCGMATPIRCGNFGCASGACKTGCTTDADCFGISKCFAPGTPGQCGGLKGEYFKNTTWSGAPASIRTDANIDLSFGNASPFPADATWPADSFTVRWTGWLTPRFTGTYVFQTLSDDGIALFLNGSATPVPGIDMPTQVGGDLLHQSGSITLTKDVPVPIRIDYFENNGFSQAHLRWANVNETGSATTFLAVPTTRLTPNP